MAESDVIAAYEAGFDDAMTFKRPSRMRDSLEQLAYVDGYREGRGLRGHEIAARRRAKQRRQKERFDASSGVR